MVLVDPDEEEKMTPTVTFDHRFTTRKEQTRFQSRFVERAGAVRQLQRALNEKDQDPMRQ